MGIAKLALDVGDATLLDRALRATAAYERVVVVSVGLVLPREAGVRCASTTYVVNDAPERGMARSLRLANAAVPAGHALAVVLADMPFVDADLIATVIAARGESDVAYPVRDGVPGHPVVFGPRAREAIARLPDGDTIRTLRADPQLRRVEIPIADDRPFIDVDTVADLASARAAIATRATERR